MDSVTNGFDSRNTKILMGIAIGAALGAGIALSRRKRTRWDAARLVSKRVAAHSEDLADTTRDIIDRVRNIYQEGRKLVEEAEQLWSRGRRLAGV